MDKRTLELFLHLSASLHFAKTSRECFISSSALTRVIQRLEQEAGQQLLLRDNRSVSLTPAGRLFRDYAAKVVTEWHHFRAAASGTGGALRGELTLFASVTACYSVLPKILGEFRRVYPDVRVKLQTGDAAGALERCLNGDADIVVAALPKRFPPGLVYWELARTPLLFIAPLKTPFLEIVKIPGKICWETTPLIVPEKGPARLRLNRWLNKNKIKPNIYAQVAGNEAILALVSLGFGVGVVPGLVLEHSPFAKQVRILKIDPVLEPYAVGTFLLRKKLADPVAKAFWDIAEQTGPSKGTS